MNNWIWGWLCCVLGTITLFIGGSIAYDTEMDHWSTLSNGRVGHVICHLAGCSLLVERPDSSSDWVWVPRIEKSKAEKE
jgi:hypothetical protein